MSLRRLFILYSFILLLFLSRVVRSETHSEGTATGTPRTSSNNQLSKEELDFLTTAFQLPKDFIQEKYGAEISSALDTTLKNPDDNTALANVISKMAGTLNKTQFEKLNEVSSTQYPCSYDKEDRLSELKKRVGWSRFVILPPERAPACDWANPAKNYADSFKKAFADVRKKNDEFYTLLEQALIGNSSAKQKLREDYDQRAILAFIDSQRKNGNGTLARQLTEALSFDEGNERILDAVGKDGSTIRVKLGNTGDHIDQALAQFDSEFPKLESVKLSPARHKAVSKTISPVFQGGAAGTGNGKTVAGPTPAPGKPGTSGSSGGGTGSSGGGGNGSGTTPTTRPDPTSGPATDLASAEGIKQIFKQNCFSCHGPGKSAGDTRIVMNEDGSIQDLDQEKLDIIMERVVIDRDMPTGRNKSIFSEDMRLAVKTWVEKKKREVSR